MKRLSSTSLFLNGKRYEFRHKVDPIPSKFPLVETNADSHWFVEGSWTKLEPRRDSPETMTDVLRRNILEGREIRIVMGCENSTDVISSIVTPNDVIVTLPRYLLPFKGVDSKQVDFHKVHFPVLGVAEKKLVECETYHQSSQMRVLLESTYDSGIDWYVSTKKWTEVAQIKHDGSVLSGSVQDLRAAGLQGHNIRLCLLDLEGVSTCHGSTALYFPPGKVILQSPSILDFYLSDGDITFDTKREKHCETNYRVISTDGSFRYNIYKPGYFYHYEKKPEYDKQTWFVEYA